MKQKGEIKTCLFGPKNSSFDMTQMMPLKSTDNEMNARRELESKGT